MIQLKSVNNEQMNTVKIKKMILMTSRRQEKVSKARTGKEK